MSGKYLISDSEREQCRLAIKAAVEQASLAYAFCPGSYSYHCLLACREAYWTINATVPPPLEQKDKA
jgi:hypothetical protein